MVWFLATVFELIGLSKHQIRASPPPSLETSVMGITIYHRPAAKKRKPQKKSMDLIVTSSLEEKLKVASTLYDQKLDDFNASRATKSPTYVEIARKFELEPSTLSRRLQKKIRSKVEAHRKEQKFTFEEKSKIVK